MIVREGIFEDAEIDVTIGPDGGRCRAVVGQERDVAVGVFEADLCATADAAERRAVEGEKIAVAKIAITNGDVEHRAVVAECGGSVHDDLRNTRVGGGVAGGDPRAVARGVDAGDAALQVLWIGTSYDKAKVDVAAAIRRYWRVDEYGAIEGRGIGRIVRQSVEGELAGRVGAASVGGIDVVDRAAGTGEVETAGWCERWRVAGDPAVRRKCVIG